MGAVTNMRPDLFKAVVAYVPFVDVINTMSDETLPLTVGEFEEWGNPKIKAEYGYMKTYCPYTNLAAKAYPALLVKTSFNDSQVMYWEPAKYVAKLRTLKTDSNPLLLKIEHGGRARRLVGALRPVQGARLRLRVRPDGAGDHEVGREIGAASSRPDPRTPEPAGSFRAEASREAPRGRKATCRPRRGRAVCSR